MAQAFLGAGWGFPIAPDASGALDVSADEQSVQESIGLILSTAKGERVMRSDFGCGIHDLVFERNTAATAGKVTQAVRQALTVFEPRIRAHRRPRRRGRAAAQSCGNQHRLRRPNHEHRVQLRVSLLSRARRRAMTAAAPLVDTRSASDVASQIGRLLQDYAPAYAGAGNGSDHRRAGARSARRARWSASFALRRADHRAAQSAFPTRTSSRSSICSARRGCRRSRRACRSPSRSRKARCVAGAWSRRPRRCGACAGEGEKDPDHLRDRTRALVATPGDA